MNDKQRAAFEAWALDYNSDFDGFSNVLFIKNGKGEYAVIRVQDACEAWQAALKSPQVQDLKDALQSILYDMENEGNGTGYEYQNAKAALAAME
jgi:nitrogen fixation-related uncharacterized protein